MKKILHSSLFLVLFLWTTAGFSQRYLTEVFTSFDSTSEVVYGQNISILTGTPALSPLRMDVYEPSGDQLTSRPLIIICHTGSFLPPVINGQPTGSRKDSTAVEMAKQFARRGYVAAIMSNRLGWLPTSPDQDTRTGTLLNAAYRGIQDLRTCVRYFRRSVAEMSNPYKIDPNIIIAGGIGTGGYITFGAATLDKTSELNLTKFINATSGQPYVIPALNGNFDGTDSTALCRPNHVGYSSALSLVFNLGGALGDSTWLEAGETPMIGFHCPTDPFAPYEYGAVIVPTTGDFVVNVSGTYGAIRRANQLGNNDGIVQAAASFNDPYTLRANALNNGYEGMFPMVRPMPSTPTTTCPDGNAYPNFPEGSPWDWWNETWYEAAVNSQQPGAGPTAVCKARLGNPDMSAAKGRLYIDSIMGYLNPRIVGTLSIVGIDNKFNRELKLYPNPAKSQVMIKSTKNEVITGVTLMDITGREIRTFDNLSTQEFMLERNGLNAGLYYVRIRFKDGEGAGKVWFE
ncbi:MAG: T9SS type A sorting domain-containing protein [Bacteroidia bacterium]|nr:T9SS type A sorting domain-containing protein [Bacteroidia bacterium]